MGRGPLRPTRSQTLSAKIVAPSAEVSGRTAQRCSSPNQPTSSVSRARRRSVSAEGLAANPPPLRGSRGGGGGGERGRAFVGPAPPAALHAEQHEREMQAISLGARHFPRDEPIDLLRRRQSVEVAPKRPR